MHEQRNLERLSSRSVRQMAPPAGHEWYVRSQPTGMAYAGLMVFVMPHVHLPAQVAKWEISRLPSGSCSLGLLRVHEFSEVNLPLDK